MMAFERTIATTRKNAAEGTVATLTLTLTYVKDSVIPASIEYIAEFSNGIAPLTKSFNN